MARQISGTKFKTLEGIDIYIETDGRFAAVIGGRVARRAKLADLERLIWSMVLDEPVRAIDPHLDGSVVLEIVGIRQREGSFWEWMLKSGSACAAYRRLLLYSEELWTALEDISRRHAEIQSEYEALVQNAEPLTRASLAGLRADRAVEGQMGGGDD